jgi:hypothetical protein
MEKLENEGSKTCLAAKLCFKVMSKKFGRFKRNSKKLLKGWGQIFPSQRLTADDDYRSLNLTFTSFPNTGFKEIPIGS